jgi:hypothetical protein
MTSWTPRHSSGLTRSGVLALNFHRIGPDSRDDVTSTVRRARRLASPLDLDEAGPTRSQPDGLRLFVSFYDGFRDTGLFGAELCASLGIRAFFFPVFSPYDAESASLTDDDLQQIAEVHEIGFHTSSHLAAREVTPDNVVQEVEEPMRRIARITGRLPRLAAWRGGTRFGEEHLGDRTLRRLGVRHLVSNWSIERLPADPARGQQDR